MAFAASHCCCVQDVAERAYWSDSCQAQNGGHWAVGPPSLHDSTHPPVIQGHAGLMQRSWRKANVSEHWAYSKASFARPTHPQLLMFAQQVMQFRHLISMIPWQRHQDAERWGEHVQIDFDLAPPSRIYADASMLTTIRDELAVTRASMPTADVFITISRNNPRGPSWTRHAMVICRFDFSGSGTGWIRRPQRIF